MVEWSYFDKFKEIDDKYLPDFGEGDNMATQIVTATAKLVYRWYNDGDVYDNTGALNGWCNDLSSYANWLADHAKGCKAILDRVYEATCDGDYEDILKDLVDLTNTEEFLKDYVTEAKEGSIYECEGDYKFVDYDDEDDFYDDEEDY